MVCNNLLALCCAYVGAKCRSCVDPRISWRCIDPRRIVDYDGVFCLWYNRGEEAVSLPFVEVGGFQDCKCLAQLVFRVSIDWGMMMPVIFVMVSFWATSMSYAPFFDNFVDIMVPSLIVEIKDA